MDVKILSNRIKIPADTISEADKVVLEKCMRKNKQEKNQGRVGTMLETGGSHVPNQVDKTARPWGGSSLGSPARHC